MKRFVTPTTTHHHRLRFTIVMQTSTSRRSPASSSPKCASPQSFTIYTRWSHGCIAAAPGGGLSVPVESEQVIPRNRLLTIQPELT